MDTSSIPGLELMQIADVVAREKSIDREEVVIAMEEAIQKAGRSKYGNDRDIRAMIDRKTGAIHLERWTEVVEDVENEATQMTVTEGAKHQIGLGEFLRQPLPPIEFGRIAAQTAKQVISQKVREAERARQYQEYKDRVGEVVIGTVKRAESYSITVDLGRAEGVIRRDQMIPRENFNQGDRVRAYIVDVREEPRGPQIFLSRAANEFMAKLFVQEVPEIYDGIIEIKAVAREPGSRAKISVLSRDSSIDPVGACVGLRGSRVQAVVSELQGEKIEIIPFSEDPVTFIVNALAPAEVAKVVVDEVAGRVEVVVPDDGLRLLGLLVVVDDPGAFRHHDCYLQGPLRQARHLVEARVIPRQKLVHLVARTRLLPQQVLLPLQQVIFAGARHSARMWKNYAAAATRLLLLPLRRWAAERMESR